MKIYISIYFVLLVSVAITSAVPDDRFHGGANDGSAHGEFIGYVPSSGGDLPRFVGSGGYDGYASAEYSGYVPPGGGELARYVGGGGYDGYAVASFAGYTPPVSGALGRYTGGGYDGSDSSTVVGLSNPLDGDSDGDGVPDWWESRYYLSLSLANADTDVDGDGMGSMNEYISDTDPNNPRSLLAIIAFRKATNIEVDCAITSVNRRYWVEASTALTAGDWDAVIDPPISGNGGAISLSFLDEWEGDAFFRVRVALP
jgi:hypothetical protein